MSCHAIIKRNHRKKIEKFESPDEKGKIKSINIIKEKNILTLAIHLSLNASDPELQLLCERLSKCNISVTGFKALSSAIYYSNNTDLSRVLTELDKIFTLKVDFKKTLFNKYKLQRYIDSFLNGVTDSFNDIDFKI